jgi:Tol biopolymer transport system component/serine/threonine protein kinase
MTADRWAAVERLCHAALEREPAARAAFLDDACAGDVDLRREVDSLLAQQSHADAFLATPAMDRAAARAGAGARLDHPRKPLAPGTRLGPYEIDALIGTGGMGEVYRARDPRLDRLIAIKVPPPELGADPDRRSRFAREARAIAALDHPNIVGIHSIEESDGVQFLTMELVQGETLDRLIARGPLSVERVLALAIPMADAVSAAHQRGIVHRDLKPANVMVAPDGRVKVLDFGLAKLVAGEGETSPLASLSADPLTREGRIIGTVAYMSPEQAEGKAVDQRTDLFSLGVIFYELATGVRPFTGDTALSVLSSIIRDAPPSVTDLNPAVPREVAKIVRHCLVKDVEHRYQSAKDLRNELEELRRELESGDVAKTDAPRVETRSGRKRWLGAVAVVVALAAVGGGYVAYRSLRQAPPPEARFTRLTSQPGMELFPSLSPDGTWIVYAAGATGDADIYLQSVGGDNPINVTKDSPDADSSPAFSPDGEQIAFRSERQGGGIFVMGRTGESVRRLTDVGFNPAWSPDGREIAFAAEAVAAMPYARDTVSVLWVVSLASGEKRQVTSTDAVQPNWSPHGHRIAYWNSYQESSSSQRDILTVAAAGGEPVRVTDDPALDWNPVWAPDGRSLYFSSDRGGSLNLWRVAIDEVSGRVLGRPQPVTVPSQAAGHMSFSADGSRMVFGSLLNLSNVERVSFDSTTGRVQGKPQPVTSGARVYVGPNASPDGGWVAMTGGSGVVEDLFIVGSDGTRLKQLTNDPYTDRFPQWSPDGSQIAFQSNRSGRPEIWTMAPDGSPPRQLSELRSTAMAPLWSPDGSRIAFVDGKARRTLIFDPRQAWDAQTPEVLPAMGAGRGTLVTMGSWSPDGRHIAGVESPGPAGLRRGVLVYHLDSRTYEKLTDFGVNGRWLADSRRLVFESDDGKLCLVDSRTRAWYELLSAQGEEIVQPALSSDNRWLYFRRKTTESDIWLATFQQAPVSRDRR